MADSKIFMLPDSVSGGGSSSGVDPNLLLTSMMNNGGGLGSGNGGWMWVIFLFFLYGWGRNGMFGNTGSDTNNYLNNDTGRLLLMEAILGNNTALQNLSNMLNTSSDAISAAIANVNTAVANVGSSVGMTGQLVINAIQSGNMSLAQQLCSCCCENKLLVLSMGYEGQLRDATNTAAITSRIDQLSNGVLTGFASTAYATQSLTNSLSRDLLNLTQTIIDKISNMESNAQLDKINDLTALLTAANARAERAAELQPIIAQLNSIKAAQPATATITYPNLVAFPSYLSSTAYNGYYNNGSSFWN